MKEIAGRNKRSAVPAANRFPMPELRCDCSGYAAPAQKSGLRAKAVMVNPPLPKIARFRLSQICSCDITSPLFRRRLETLNL
jgi:hypothetical protein